MAVKRSSAVDESRPTANTNRKKKKERGQAKQNNHKKQTSLLSFFGKNVACTKATAKEGISEFAAHRDRAVKNADPAIAITTSPELESKNNRKASWETTNKIDIEKNIIDKYVDEMNAEPNSADRENSIETIRIEEKSSVAITPCKQNKDSTTDQAKAIGSSDEKHTLEDSSPPGPMHRVENDDDDNNATRDNPTHGLSEYEKLRLRNIERNNARLAALGLLTTPAPNGNRSGSSSDRRRPPRKKPKIHQRAPQQPLRRSSRNRNPKQEANGSSTDGSTIVASSTKSETIIEREAQQQEEKYTVSPLLQYEMSRLSNSAVSSSRMENKPLLSSSDMCLRVTGPRFVPPKGLNAIYSLEFWRDCDVDSSTAQNGTSNWLVGAGKAGMIALWDANTESQRKSNSIIATATTSNATMNEEFVDPVLSWKAHSGRWIADAKFLPGPTPTPTPSRLITAGNDGTICLWDLSTVSFSTGAPKLLHRTGKSHHNSGIFSMDTSFSGSTTSQVMICTGSKDKSVVVSSLDSLLRDSPLWRSDFHTAKVGAVQLKSGDSTLLLSASDDGLVGLHDYRSPKTVAKLEDAHIRPHSVVWDGTVDNTFCTAGLDPVVKLWDQRNLSEPLVSLQGHVPTSTTKCKRIHKPVFFNPNGSHVCPFLLTGGQGSSSVSVYTLLEEETWSSKKDFKLSSRGRLPEDCGDSGCIAVSGRQVAVTVDQGEILLLEPNNSAKL